MGYLLPCRDLAGQLGNRNLFDSPSKEGTEFGCRTGRRDGGTNTFPAARTERQLSGRDKGPDGWPKDSFSLESKQKRVFCEIHKL